MQHSQCPLAIRTIRRDPKDFEQTGTPASAMRDNIGKFEQRFGPIPQMPKPPQPPKPPTIQEIYDDLKMMDDMHAGSYANAVMIGHGPSEFTFDFITRFFPNAAVSARVAPVEERAL